MNQPLPSGVAATPDEDQVLADLVEQWTRQLHSGEAIDWQGCARDYPQYADQLRELWPALQALAGVGDKSAEVVSNVARSASKGAEWPTNTETPNAVGVLGDYRLRREIGRGGMGVVYEADQISLRRRVALKVLPFVAALDGRQLQRFKTEAQAAAQLHHSNIVPVFAVGCEQGVHYYAMQFIEGQTLAQLIHELRVEKEDGRPKIEDRGLEIEGRVSRMDDGGSKENGRKSETGKSGTTVNDRAQPPRSSMFHARSSIPDAPSSFFRTVADLGIQAAEALEYAHQMGVVHRDIKPANLLIEISSPITNHTPLTNNHSPLKLWITDFGLARYQTDAGLTGTGDVLGTLRYMSPEQAQGQHGTVDHRTDIYALGMSLYELLTLRPAFSGQTREEVLAQLMTVEPGAPRRLNRAIPIELETIVLKALAKRPKERYGSALELADDLRRFLEDKPILARRPSLADKARKWARRHKGLMRALAVMASLAFAGLIISTVIIARERHETEMRRRQARRAVDEMYSQFAESMLSRQPGMEQLEKEFLLKALQFYQEFSREEGADPELRFETAKAFRRMGDIYYKLGQLDKCAEVFQEANTRLERLVSELPTDKNYRRELALTRNNRASVFRDQGRMNEAEEAYRKAEQLLETRDGEEAAIPLDDRESLAGVENNLGIVLTALGRCKEAEQSYRRALAMFEKLAADQPASPSYRYDLSGCLNDWGNLLVAMGRFRESEKFLSRALAIREKLVADYPTFPAYRQALPVSHTSFGALLSVTARYEEATQHYRHGQAMLEKLTKDFPATPSYRQESAGNAVGLGCVLTALGRLNDAEKSHRHALALREALAVEYPGTVSFRQEAAASHAYLGQLAFLTGRYAEAERASRQALILRQKLMDEDADGRHGHDVAASHHQLASLLARLGRLSEAESHYRQALNLQSPESPRSAVFDRLGLASCHSDLAVLLDGLGRHADSETELRNSLEGLRQLIDEFPDVIPVRMVMCAGLDHLSRVYQNTGRASEAEKSLSLAAALAQKCTAEMPANPDCRRQHARLQIRQAERLAAGGQTRQAEEAFPKGVTLLAKLADDYPAVPEFRRELAQGLDLLACLLARQGRKSAGAQTFRQVRQLLEELTRNSSETPGHFQELAWFLATCPDESFRDPKVALQMAERAVALAPEQGDCWSALGIAHYRSGDWKKGETALQEAIRLRSGGGCADWLFLAMICHQLGELAQARQWFDKAAVWMEQNQPAAEDLTRFRAEAEAVIAKGGGSAELQRGMGGQ